MNDQATPDDSGWGGPQSKARRAWMILLITLAVGLALDLGTKSWTFAFIAEDPVVLDRERMLADPDYDPVPQVHDPMVLAPGVLHLRLAINRGAVFGLGANRRMFFIVFTLVAMIGGLYVFRRMTRPTAWGAHIAIGLVMAGGVGNLYDRVAFAAVRDFIQLLPGYRLPSGWSWPGGNPEMFPWVFNPADVFLLLGMMTLMLYLSRQRKTRLRETDDEGDPATVLA